MTAAMRFVCSAGMWLATGVLIGSLFWELLAAADLSIMIMAYRGIAAGIMMFGGFYLAFLSYRALRSFWRTSTGVTVSSKASVSSEHGLFLKGFAIHPTNPQSVLAWAAIIAIVLAPDSATLLPFMVVIAAGFWALWCSTDMHLGRSWQRHSVHFLRRPDCFARPRNGLVLGLIFNCNNP